MTGSAAAPVRPAPPSLPALPQAFFLPAPEGGQRFCLFHQPAPGAPPRGRVLFCPPFAEELNTTRRTVARQARALAEAGFSVLQIDPLGCGDSSGGFEDASWPAWLADLELAHAWLSQRASGPLWLWGLRAGALLASDLAAQLPEPSHLLLWQPAASGQQQLQQFLRLHAAGQWLAGDKTGAVKKTDTPAQQLALGQSVHIAGYPLNPALAHGLAAARLQPPVSQPPGHTVRHMVWLEFTQQTAPASPVSAEPMLRPDAAITPQLPDALASAGLRQAQPERVAGLHRTGVPSPASEKALAAWQAAGWQVNAQTVASPAFWQTVEAEAAPGIETATIQALLAEPIQDAKSAEATASTAASLAQPSAVTAAMTAQEHAITIAGPQADMLGIVSLPAAGLPVAGIGVVIVVGGAQYRVGSHRQFVLLARHLAQAGHPVLRFDLPGMGDSAGQDIGFEDTAPHIAAAISALQQHCPGVERVVLWGLCDGASASLLYTQATADPRVAGLALLNPWVRSEAGLARTQVKHYYRQRLLEPAFWRKLLAGGVGWQALRSFGSRLRAMQRPAPASANTFQERMAQGWSAFPGPILLLLSERDLTAQEFTDYANSSEAWRGWRQKPLLEQHTLPGADHTCATPNSSALVECCVLEFLRRGAQRAAEGVVTQ
jgi:exosortase A-associated hydrolase 1/exosortase A-associated hydrolase 2